MRKRTENWALVGATIVAGLAILLVALRFVLPVELPVARTSTSYGWLREEQIAVTAAGAAGAATGSQDSDGPVRGHVYAVHLDYGAAVTTTTDITISLSSPALTLYQKDDSATDVWLYPVVQQTDSAGSGTSTYDRVPVSGNLTVKVDQSTSGTAVTATVWWGE